MITLRPYQTAAVHWTRMVFQGGLRAVLLVAPTGCHRAGQKVLLYNGKTRSVEDIKVNDLLMGPDSIPRRVGRLCRGRQQMARIVPTKGDPFVVNLDHVLTLVRTNDGTEMAGAIVDVTVREWLSWSRTQKHIHKLLRTGIEFKRRDKRLPIHPYFLGVLLGDGSTKGNVRVHSNDPEIAEMCEDEAERWGVRLHTRHKRTVITHSFSLQRGMPNPLIEALRDLDLDTRISHDKFVPHAYKVASRYERLLMLAGLMDSDGHMTRGGFDYISQSEILAKDTAFIARSVGLAAYVSRSEKYDQYGHGGWYWRVSISGDCSVIPTRVARKKAPIRQQKKDHLRTGFTVELLEEEDFFGFTLDGDGRYLLDDFTVTHNSGKTPVIGWVIAKTAERGKTAAFIAHRTELLTQCINKLLELGIDARDIRVLRRGRWEGSTTARVLVASVQSLDANPLPPVDILAVDEAHRSMSTTHQRVIRSAMDLGARVVGCTATPERLDGQRLGAIYQAMYIVEQPTVLVRGGYLLEPDVWTVPDSALPDLAGIGTEEGDYARRELSARMQKRELVGAIVPHWLAHAERRPTVCFAVDRAHSLAIVAEYRAAGVRATHIDAKSSAHERKQALAWIQDGTLEVVSNVDLWVEGIDAPPLGCVQLARPTQSVTLHLQQIGRILRPFPGKKKPRVLDHAANVVRLGMPIEDRVWSLEGRTKAPPNGSAAKACPRCYYVVEPSTMLCPACGHVWEETPERTRLKSKEGDLVRVDDEAVWARRHEAWHKLYDRAVIANVPDPLGWVQAKFVKRFRVEPRATWTPMKTASWAEKRAWLDRLCKASVYNHTSWADIEAAYARRWGEPAQKVAGVRPVVVSPVVFKEREP